MAAVDGVEFSLVAAVSKLLLFDVSRTELVRLCGLFAREVVVTVPLPAEPIADSCR